MIPIFVLIGANRRPVAVETLGSRLVPETRTADRAAIASLVR